jgi:hypothetical protein
MEKDFIGDSKKATLGRFDFARAKQLGESA